VGGNGRGRARPNGVRRISRKLLIRCSPNLAGLLTQLLPSIINNYLDEGCTEGR